MTSEQSAVWTPSPHLWIPQRRGVLDTIDHLMNGKDVVLYSPTGGGKTEQAMQLFDWANFHGLNGIFYVNRRLLIDQTANRFAKAGLKFGIRAAEYEAEFDASAPFQVASADSEGSRVFNKKEWSPHHCSLVVVDEAHIQKTKVMDKIIEDHKSRGAQVVRLTATPVEMSNYADEIVISGTMQEYRDCKALVWARVYSVEYPDLRNIKRNATGEYMMNGEVKRWYTQQIHGRVWENYVKYNPHRRPTMMFAPGKAESVFLTEYFTKMGANWCHIDATDAVVDGKRAKLTRPLWNEILERYKDGSIKGLSSRFKLREGVDVPITYHAILATPIGSLASYIQTIGRILRYSKETDDHVIVTDHGGSYLRHGSPNADRPWDELWSLPEKAVSELHTNRIRDGKIKEPICCVNCGMERGGAAGTCRGCGLVSEKSKRQVLQVDGELTPYEGKMVPLRVVKKLPSSEDDWKQMFWGYRNKATNTQSFEQMYAFFQHIHGYAPPRDLPYMPVNTMDWLRPVSSVAFSRLHEDAKGRRA